MWYSIELPKWEFLRHSHFILAFLFILDEMEPGGNGASYTVPASSYRAGLCKSAQENTKQVSCPAIHEEAWGMLILPWSSESLGLMHGEDNQLVYLPTLLTKSLLCSNCGLYNCSQHVSFEEAGNENRPAIGSWEGFVDASNVSILGWRTNLRKSQESPRTMKWPFGWSNVEGIQWTTGCLAS